jgi:hypothetical protein
MKLSIDVTPSAGGGWLLNYRCDDAAVNIAPRELTLVSDADRIFPLPPIAESGLWDGKAHAPLCVAAAPGTIDDVLQQLTLGQPDSASMQLFGNYLTAVLLGPFANTANTRMNSEPVEIALAIAPEAAAMQRLPWELMYRDQEPLAANMFPLAFVRRVKRDKQPDLNKLELPLRVLFVVGQSIDASIRPGAEYMALLRRLGTSSDVVNLNTRLLLRATKNEIAMTVDHFAPSVVHFICHGDMGESGATLMLTEEESGQKTARSEPVSAKGLLDLLRGHSGAANLPSVVVLNACHTAEVNTVERKNAYRGFAETLVAGGIAVAVGMAGEVADGACRLFTTGFYEALIAGKRVALAPARGRSAALRHYNSYSDTIEWARPLLFVAGDIDMDNLKSEPGKAAVRARAAAKYLRLTNPRAFCDRLSCIQAFEQLLLRTQTGSGIRFVLPYSIRDPIEKVGDYKPQYGKSRLLEELSARLAVDGIAPILLRNEIGGDRPKNAFAFADRVGELADLARERFGRAEKKRECSFALEFAFDAKEIAWDRSNEGGLDIARFKLHEKLTAEKSTIEIDAPTLHRLLAREARQLVADLADAGVTNAAILIDDLHLYENVVDTLLKACGDHGLGDAPIAVPIIFTYVYSTTGNGSTIDSFMTNNGHQEIRLGRFLDHEEKMAHRQFLLTRMADPLAVTNKRDQQEKVPFLDNQFCTTTSGLPSGWEKSDFLTAVEIFQKFQLLIAANDEEIVKQYG